MGYYRATIEDFFVGRVYEQQAGDSTKWMKSIFTKDYLETRQGHSYFLEIITNLMRFKDRFPYYRIKYLDDADITSFGFQEYEDRNFSDEGVYRAFKLGNNTLLLFSDRMVQIYEDTQKKGKISVSKIFAGQLLDINELKNVLLMTGILYDAQRKIKFTEPISQLE